MKDFVKIAQDRIRGAILGTAIGDALGMPAEGLKPESIQKYYGKIKGFRSPNPKRRRIHDLKRGQWTDDTQLMLAIGESIIECGGINYENIMQRHVEAFSERRGWGKATTNSVQRYISGAQWNDSGMIDAAGNGPPMKIAPIGVLYGMDIIDHFELVTVVVNISRMTHRDARATVSAILQAKLVSSGIKYGLGGVKNLLEHLHADSILLENALSGLEIAKEPLSSKIYDALALARMGASDEKIREEIGAGPFVNQSYAFMCALMYKYIDDPETCLEEIINQGGDCDTTGAMAGSIIGAACGYSIFPYRWKRCLEDKKRLITLADKLWKRTI